MFGVSPAYFFSRYTTSFSVEDYAQGLENLHKIGFEGFQLEIFSDDRLEEWMTKYHIIRERAGELGMQVTQFVAHFLLTATSNENSLVSQQGLDEMKQVVEIVSGFPECKIITLPISPCRFGNDEVICKAKWEKLWESLCIKILSFASIVENAGRKLALEIVPGSLFSGTEGLLRFSKETGNTSVGYNFDTGHAWCCKENIATIPAKLCGRIYGTHLKDNFGNENLALPPGEGSIPWKSVIHGLLKTGYTSSLDLEISSDNPQVVDSLYQKGKSNLKEIISSYYEE